MRKRKVFWFSPHLGRELTLVRWGYSGRPVVLFPTAGGDAEECERMWMIRALGPLIDAGRIKVYSVDHIAGWHWIDDTVAPARKVAMQQAFDAFVSEELTRAIRLDCGGHEEPIICAGYSLGGYQAFAAALRHPELFDTAICMSSPYDLSGWVEEGPRPHDFHYVSPLHFLPLLEDPEALAALRKTRLFLVHGRGPHEKPWRAWPVADLLGRKGIANRVDIWDESHDHDWVAWRDQLPMYLDHLS
jgi:esterase/lipase superfamily enzyme